MMELSILAIPCVLILIFKYVKNKIYIVSAVVSATGLVTLLLYKDIGITFFIQFFLFFMCFAAICLFIFQDVKTRLNIFAAILAIFLISNVLGKEHLKTVTAWLAYGILTLLVIVEIYEYRKNK